VHELCGPRQLEGHSPGTGCQVRFPLGGGFVELQHFGRLTRFTGTLAARCVRVCQCWIGCQAHKISNRCNLNKLKFSIEH
jgi:hypothetical protein